jgi:tetratricopeptide (TPR) repeat protein
MIDLDMVDRVLSALMGWLPPEWRAPVAVLAIGALTGVVLALRSRTSVAESDAISAAGLRDDLENRRDVAVQALRDLELERDKLSPEDYARQRQELLTLGADAMRRLDTPTPATAAQESPMSQPPDAAALSEQTRMLLDFERKRMGDAAWRAAMLREAGVNPAEAGAAAPAPAPVRPAPRPPPGMIAPEWKGALWALAAVGCVAVLVWAAGGSSTAREGSMPITGGIDAPTSAPPAEDPEKATMLARLDKDPNDLEALNKLTIISISADDAQSAMQYNERALAIDAKDATARLNRAILRHMMGMSDKALELIEEVIADNPDLAMAYIYKGVIALDARKADDAISAFEKAKALGVDTPMVTQGLEQAHAIKEGRAPAPPPTAPPSGGPPMMREGSSGQGAVIVSGTISLAPGAEAAVPQAQVVFVSVKNPAGGPPLAALKLPVGPFPMEFQVTEGDKIAMGGMDRPIPDVVQVSVRLDFDGNPMSHADSEPGIVFDNLAKGTQKVAAVLK